MIFTLLTYQQALAEWVYKHPVDSHLIKKISFIFHMLPCKLFIWEGAKEHFGYPLFKSWPNAYLLFKLDQTFINNYYLLRLLLLFEEESLVTSVKNEQFQLSIIVDSSSSTSDSWWPWLSWLDECDWCFIHDSNPCCKEGITGGSCVWRKYNTMRVSA